MRFDSKGWLVGATYRSGPHQKQNNGANGNGLLGVAHHSAEGFEQGLYDVLFGPRNASWHFSNLRDGRLIQHYSVFAQTWTSGARYVNDNFPSIESEGVAGMPLTLAQIENVGKINFAVMQLSERLSATRELSLIGTKSNHVLLEHREATRWGAAATACPSNRYVWPTILTAINSLFAPQPQIPDEVETPTILDEGDESVLIKEPGVDRVYLRTGFKMAWIPDEKTYHGLVTAYGEPKAVNAQAFWFLVEEHKAAGYKWG